MDALEASRQCLIDEVDAKIAMAGRSKIKYEAEEEDVRGKLKAAQNAAEAASREIDRIRGVVLPADVNGSYQ
jgi:hypothetical protein